MTTFAGLGVHQAARPIVVGIVHGLAGSAAVALLVLTTIRDPRWAVAYMLVQCGAAMGSPLTDSVTHSGYLSCTTLSGGLL
jgi:hypothetical protein